MATRLEDPHQSHGVPGDAEGLDLLQIERTYILSETNIDALRAHLNAYESATTDTNSTIMANIIKLRISELTKNV